MEVERVRDSRVEDAEDRIPALARLVDPVTGKVEDAEAVKTGGSN